MEPIIKTPGEVIPRTIYWIDKLPSGVTVSSCTATAQNVETLEVATSSIFVSATGTCSGQDSTFRLQGGLDTEKYLLTFTATGSDGNTYQAYTQLSVKAARV